MIIQFHNVLTNTIYKLYANYGRQVYYVKIGEWILVCISENAFCTVGHDFRYSASLDRVDSVDTLVTKLSKWSPVY